MKSKRKFTVVALAIGGIVLYWLITTLIYVAPVDRYERAGDDRHLRVYALIGAGDAEFWHIVRSGDTEIQVVVLAKRTPPRSRVNELVGQSIQISVELDAPLGGRRVIDAYGHVARDTP